MQHDLIGFLIDALESPERECIEERLKTDERLQGELEQTLVCLHRLNWDAEPYPAPTGLAERTCVFVASQGKCVRPASRFDQMLRKILAVAWRGQKTDDRARKFIPIDASDLVLRPDHSLGPVHGTRPMVTSDAMAGETGGWTFADFVVAAGICVAASCLFFPAILNSRYNTQLVQCQNNMRQLGTALQQYSDENNGYFPIIPAKGNLAFAGAYAALLRDKGLISEDHAQLLCCPSRGGTTLVIRIPRSQDVNDAQGATLVMLRNTMGGDYAYSLGFMEDGKLHGIRRNKNQQRAQHVILADAPVGGASREFRGVHGRGQNVLFEDGHAAFLGTRMRPGVRQDDFFVNDKGYVEAGMHSQDCVLGSSPTPPVVFVRD